MAPASSDAGTDSERKLCEWWTKSPRAIVLALQRSTLVDAAAASFVLVTVARAAGAVFLARNNIAKSSWVGTST